MELTRESDPVKAYTEDIDSAEDLTQLRRVCDEYKEIAFDAKAVADSMTEDDFDAFRLGMIECRMRRSPGKDWDDKYSAIALPLVFTTVTCVSVYYKVPWGTAYGRMLDAGLLTADSGGVLSIKERV